MYPFGAKFHGKNTYFISDLHFNHKNIVLGESRWSDKAGCRPFNSTLEMNQQIVDSLKTLNQDSVLFILGDILFGDKFQLEFLMDNIICKEIHYIFGNHCNFIRGTDYERFFDSCSDYLEIFCKGRTGHDTRVCLFHYPIKSWHDRGKGSYVLSGHVHGNMPYSESERGLDMDWNIWRKPVNFFEIEDILSKRTYSNI